MCTCARNVIVPSPPHPTPLWSPANGNDHVYTYYIPIFILSRHVQCRQWNQMYISTKPYKSLRPFAVSSWFLVIVNSLGGNAGRTFGPEQVSCAASSVTTLNFLEMKWNYTIMRPLKAFVGMRLHVGHFLQWLGTSRTCCIGNSTGGSAWGLAYDGFTVTNVKFKGFRIR